MEILEPGSAQDVERLPGSVEEDVFIFPASFAQQRLWFLHQLEPENPAYNVSAAVRLDGVLDEAALARSLNEIVRRHEALRTTFTQLDGAPVQLITPALTIPLPVVDLQAWPAAEQEPEALRQATEEARRLFDLSRGPLIRATLLRLGREAHILLVSMHHIVSDGWSVGVFVRELTSLYQAFAAGAPSPLPELSIQYADFAHWQRQWLSGAEFERQLGYWKRQLAGAPPVLELPTDRPRTATETGRGGTQHFELSADLTRELKSLSQRSHGTLFMTLLSAFAVLLSRYCREEDVVIGSPIANRNRSEIEPLIGFFVNTLALRVDLSGDPTFSELLGRVRRVTLDAYSHQDLPFERLVDELHLERNLGRSPLFQVLFALQNAPAPPLELAGLSVRRLELDFQTVRFDLEVHVWEVGDELRGSLVYNADLFDAAGVARLAAHWQTLLAGVAANPASPVSQLPLMSAEERRRLLVEWNETSREYPRACVHEVFEARAAERPEAVALIFEERQLTYRELNARANQLAHHLQSLGVGMEVPVGLCLERSPEMIVGMLGILKAGGAIVPLSPTYPRERLAFMMRDTRAPVILTDERQAGHLPEVEARVIRLDGDWAIMARESESNVASATTADNLAYIIYTSGSTGTPKGVEVYHRGILRLLFGVDYVTLGPEQTSLQFAPISFDTSYLEIWGALLHGGRCVLFPNHDLTAAELGEVVRKHGVSLMWLTGSLFNVIIDEDPGALAGVAQVVVGGEALSVPHIERALASLPETQLVNGYGPTECTTFGACYRIPRAVEPGRTSIPIGRPIANTEAYVLDRHSQPVPIGVPGELHLGGPGVARGYFNRPELTAERFIPNPFGGEPGARLYRTGDLTRFLPDGTLEYLGRIDRQVKIRGFRIEPGEIEAQLLKHPAVREAAVIVREDKAGDKRLAACIVPEPEYAAAAEERPALAAEQVSGWAGIFDEYIHEGEAEVADPLFNITGWVSSYDGRPIPPEQMRVWAEDIGRQALALKPRRVLEIGCGTGLILFQVAPHCEAYYGVDISQASLDYVRRQMQRRGAEFSHVSLARRSADELDDLEAGSFDAVILSSVVQYFPSVEYLLRVIERGIRAVRPGGAILLADVRSLPLLRAFHAGVELHGAEGDLPTGELRARVEEQVRQETELCIDPAFFPALRERFPEISAVQLRLERGREHNELNKFRYNAILHLGREADPAAEGRLLDGGGKSFEEIRLRLAEKRPERLCVQNITDARLRHDLRCAELLAEGGLEKVSEVRRALAEAGAEGGDAEEMWRVAEELGYRAEAFWSEGGEGKFDAVFVRQDVADGGLTLTPFARRPTRARPWSSYANRPLRAKLGAALISETRQYLAEALPDYMVPASFILLDELPLSPSGKADHRALLKLAESARPESEAEDVAPRTPVEEALSAIWVRVLGLETISVYDNFFNLGGHSLLAIQLIAQVRQSFEVNLPLRRLFESPTVAGLAGHIEAAGRGAQPADDTSGDLLPRITPDQLHRYEPFPLTDVQSAYWIGRREVFELGNVAAHAYVEVDGVNLDLERLNLAWQQIVERHEMLRAVFLPDGRQQILERVPPYQIEVLDLRGQEPQLIEARLAALRQEMSHRVLPADGWPLFEIRATRLDEGRTRLHIGLDALTGDAHSFNLLFSEWFRLYRTPGLALAPLELSFRDYVLAEEALRDSESARRAEEYWFNRLDSLPPAPELPLARNPATLAEPKFTSYNATLDAASWGRLKERARQRELTPSGVLLAAFAEVLATWSKSPRLTINLTLFNRLPLHPQVNEIVGDFTSLTLLEVDNSAPEPFAARAKRLQQQLWQDLDHRAVGGVRVMRELARRQRRSPQASMPVVFTSVLGLGDYDDAGFGLSNFGELAYATNQTPQVWLDHGVLEREGELVCVWNVVEELFPAGMLEEMFEAYVGLLRALAATESAWQRPHRPLLPAHQQERRLEVNDTAAPVSDELLHTLFIRQAQARPQAPAVISAAGRLSYGQLLGRAAAVANRLRQLQARAEEPVAVVMEKGPEQVIAVLGVLMAGAAYVPLESAWPRQRLWSLIERTGARLVLTQCRLRERLAWPGGVTVISVDQLAEEPSEPLPEPLSTPDDLAYVIFTSGSTGEPKGVMIDHRGAVNTVLDINQRFGVGAGDRVLALSSLSFDLSVYDLFGLLAAGGAIVLPEAEREKDPEHWLELIAAERVTVWNTVPALMQMLVEYAEGPKGPAAEALRLVLLSGDWVPVNLPGRVRGRWPGARVISLGGATEASIWSIYHEVREVPAWWKSIPYGRPLSNQQFAVLNPLLEDCPEWVVGDIYIGGIGLARGYWGDEEKSAARFISHPATGQRLYKTGDLGRYLADGEIEFLGREDFQVKINGYRIELGEVEAALQGHPLVREAVVSAVGQESGQAQLVAYVVVEPTAAGGGTGAQSGVAPAPASSQGVALDALGQLEFKLRRAGLRELRPEAERVGLAGEGPESEAVAARYLTRQSYREFEGRELRLAQLGGLLGSLRALEREQYAIAKYRYPSAGSLYPVQTYLYIKPERVAGLGGGWYYYHPARHELVRVGGEPGLGAEAYGEINRAIYEASAFAIFLVGEMDAIAPVYGEKARDFSLLEAGYMGQLLMSESEEFEIGLCPIGEVEGPAVRAGLELGASQEVLHSLVGGPISRAQSERWRGGESLGLGATGGQQLRAYLAERLPGYMVPSNVVMVERMPLSSNGKVDRQALAQLGMTRSRGEGGGAVAATAWEQKVAALVAGVLGVSEVGVGENLFDLGASSIHLVRLQRKLHEELGKEVPIVELFGRPTVRALAEYLGRDAEGEAELGELGEAAKRRKAERQRRLERRGIRDSNPNSGNGGEPAG